MINFDEYIRQDEPQKREKGYAWQTAIGLQAVDGLKPSHYLIETARKDIEGEITIDEAEQLIKSYYQSKEARHLKMWKCTRRIRHRPTFADFLLKKHLRLRLSDLRRFIVGYSMVYSSLPVKYEITTSRKRNGYFVEIQYSMFPRPIFAKRLNTTWNKNVSSTIQKWTGMD